LLQGFVIVVAVLAGIMTGSLLPAFPFWGGCTAGILVYVVLGVVLDTIFRHGFSVRVTR
jgi:zinc transporter ZupT